MTLRLSPEGKLDWRTATLHAEAAFRNCQWDEARSLFQRALDQAEEARDPVLIALCLNNMAVFCRNRGEYREARAHLERALRLRPFPGELVDFCTVLTSNLALVMHRSGQLGQARRLYNEALQEIPSGSDPYGPWVGPMYNLAMLNLQQGKPTQAESLLKRMRQLAERDWGEDHPYRGMLSYGFGLVDVAQERLARAEAHFRRALQSVNEQDPDDALLASRVRVGLATVYTRQAVQAGSLAVSMEDVDNKQKEAESYFEDALRTIKSLKGAICPEYADCVSAFADYLIACSRHPESERWLNELIDTIDTMYGMEHPQIVSGLERVVVVQRALGNHAAVPEIESLILSLRHKIKLREIE